MPQRTKSPNPRSAATSLVQTLRAESDRKSIAGRARAESLVALILRRKQRIAEDFFEIGDMLRELLRRKLYIPLGFDSFDALLTGRKLMGPTQARKLVAVVDAYTREQALALGVEKAVAVITYAAATPSHEVPQLVLTTGIDGKALESLSVREIVAKARRVRSTHKAPKQLSPAEKEARAAASGWQAALRKRGLREAEATVRHAEGHTFIVVRVPVEAVVRVVGRKPR